MRVEYGRMKTGSWMWNKCEVCGATLVEAREEARTCSPACRQKLYRQRLDQDATLLPPDPDRWSSKRARLLNETADRLVRTLETMVQNDLPRLNDEEQMIVQHKLLQARLELNSMMRKFNAYNSRTV